jgi:hypothetical protein
MGPFIRINDICICNPERYQIDYAIVLFRSVNTPDVISGTLAHGFL